MLDVTGFDIALGFISLSCKLGIKEASNGMRALFKSKSLCSHERNCAHADSNVSSAIRL